MILLESGVTIWSLFMSLFCYYLKKTCSIADISEAFFCVAVVGRHRGYTGRAASRYRGSECDWKVC